MKIRPATPRDAGAIAVVHRLSRADYYGSVPDPDDGREAMWAHFLADSDRVSFVAESAGGIDGVMSVRRSTDLDATVELTAIYVHPDRFGRGVGSQLYEVFEDGRADHESAILEVWDGNRRAVRFYERRGWTRTNETRPGPQGRPFVTYRLPGRLTGG